MPNIAEMKDINGELWVRVGVAGQFESGIALWTPDEQELNYQQGFRDGIDRAKELAEIAMKGLKK